MRFGLRGGWPSLRPPKTLLLTFFPLRHYRVWGLRAERSVLKGQILNKWLVSQVRRASVCGRRAPEWQLVCVNFTPWRLRWFDENSIVEIFLMRRVNTRWQQRTDCVERRTEKRRACGSVGASLHRSPTKTCLTEDGRLYIRFHNRFVKMSPNFYFCRLWTRVVCGHQPRVDSGSTPEWVTSSSFSVRALWPSESVLHQFKLFAASPHFSAFNMAALPW